MSTVNIGLKEKNRLVDQEKYPKICYAHELLQIMKTSSLARGIHDRKLKVKIASVSIKLGKARYIRLAVFPLLVDDSG